jgi:hypothetical protein
MQAHPLNPARLSSKWQSLLVLVSVLPLLLTAHRFEWSLCGLILLPVSESYRSGCGPAFLLFDESRSSTPCACVLGICISYLRVLQYPLDDMFCLRDLTWCRSPYSLHHNLAQGNGDSDGYCFL